MADFNQPTNTSLYSEIWATVRGLVASVAIMDFSSDTNVPSGAKRYDGTKNIFQQWNGSSWVNMAIGIPNATFFQSRNAADNANISMLGADNADNTEINAITGKQVQVTIAGVQQAAFDGSGNFFLNTTTQRNSAKQSLDYDGNSAGGIGINDTGSANGSAFVAFLTGGTFRGSITNNTNTAVAYNETSDYRLKENIVPMSDGIAKVRALNPCSYTWKESGQTGQGFIAHEVAAVVPDAVTGDKDAVDAEGNIIPQQLAVSRLVGVLCAAIKELDIRLTALEG